MNSNLTADFPNDTQVSAATFRNLGLDLNTSKNKEE